MEKLKRVMDSFMNEHQANFIQYFEWHREKKLLNREDYIKLENKKKAIFDEFPKVRTFLQDEQILDMTDDEKDAILKAIEIQEHIKIIELKEAFKLGCKEAYIFFEEQGMLNI